MNAEDVIRETKMVMESLSHERADELEDEFFASAAARLDFQQRLLMIARGMAQKNQDDSYQACLKVMAVVSAMGVWSKSQNS